MNGSQSTPLAPILIQQPDDIDHAFDLCIVCFGNRLELFKGLFHCLFGYSTYRFSIFI